MMATCAGCGLTAPANNSTPDPRLNASAECWQIYGEVEGFELNNLIQLGRFHQLSVDAYGAQHAGANTASIRLAYSLVGLFLALEHGWAGLEVRSLHQRMGRPDSSWPKFSRPANPGTLTVLDVAEAGGRAGSVEGHADAVQRWANSVWNSWAEHRAAVASLSRRFVRDSPHR